MKMTSTQFNVGLNGEPRSSSRVLRPPGGGHTDIFGGDPEPPRGRRLAPNAAAAACSLGRDYAAEKLEKERNEAAAAAQNGAAQTPEVPQAPQSTPEPIQESNAVPETKPEPAKETKAAGEKPRHDLGSVEPPRRVRVPPGGFSSGLW